MHWQKSDKIIEFEDFLSYYRLICSIHLKTSFCQWEEKEICEHFSAHHPNLQQSCATFLTLFSGQLHICWNPT